MAWIDSRWPRFWVPKRGEGGNRTARGGEEKREKGGWPTRTGQKSREMALSARTCQPSMCPCYVGICKVRYAYMYEDMYEYV